MRPAHLAAAITIVLAVQAGIVGAAELPRIGGLVTYIGASGTVTVNGVPTNTFSIGKDGAGAGSVDLTDWLANGTNEIMLTVKPAGEWGKATLVLRDLNTGEAMASVEQAGAGSSQTSIEIDGMPDWAWSRATPQEDSTGLDDALASLHAAFRASDVDAITDVSAPFLADQQVLGGMTPSVFAESIALMLEAGELQDLPKLTIIRHLGGRLFRVTGPDDRPPVTVLIERDGASGWLGAGQWWSMIDGAWQVVR